MDIEKITNIVIEELKKLGYKIESRANDVSYMNKVDNQPYKRGFFLQDNFLKNKFGSYSTLPKGKKLITEYDVKNYLKTFPETKEFVVAENTILGPLAEDFLNSLGIKIVYKK